MSTKRKLVVDKSTEEDCSSPAPTVAKKRKGRLTNAEKELRQMEMIKGKYVFAKIRKQQNSDGESIVNRFIRIPSRRVDSKFYEEIENPVDITQIQQKLKNPDYRKFEEFCNDIQLLVRNSKKYYGEESAEFKDAQLIEEAFEEAKQKVDSGEYQDEVEDSDDGREASLEVETEKEPVYTRRVKKEILEGGDKNEDDGDENEEDDDFEIDIHNINDLIATILEYTDSTGRLLCPPFRVLHSQTEFPLYYEKIDNPIDLKTIAIKGKEGKYETMLELKKDLNLLFNNAQTFSGIKSDIFKDAAELKKCVQLKSAKISEKGTHPKRRAKSSMLVDALITQTSADEHFSEDSEEDEDTENDSNPLWQLYWKIRNAKHEKDRSITLADHFLELPSKSFYPDYFDEIKTPISLFMINKKLKNGGYKMEELIKDLMQMYENAFEYNLETSEVYIAAEKLKQLTLTTAKQLEPCLDLSQFADKLPPSPTKSPPKHRVRTKAEIETDSDDESLTATSIKRKSPKKNRELNGSGRGRKSHSEMNEIMQNRHVMLMLWNSVYNHRISPNDSYWPAGAFIELPSPKQYPEYYQVIEYPIDMKMIRQKIDTNQYRLVEEMVDDIRKMFANAREFNEPKSNIHQDAIRLEQVLLRTYEAIRNDPSIMPRNIGTPARLKLNMKSISARGTPKGGPGRRKKHADGSDDEINRTINRSSKYRKTNEPFEMQMLELPEGEQKMFRLFYAIQNYRDETNRNLSVNFFRLPTREEFPGYYDVIRKPMDMMKIQQKLKGKAYLTLSDIVADFQLMFGNACRFNETGSSLYKDAVKLQQVLMELKQMFSSAEKVPKVQVEIRTIFISIFASIFNKKDEEGNCYSDELVELTEILKAKGVPESEWPFSLDQIKINIDKYRYRRLDRIQKDFFDLFETARQMAKIGSKMYKAAIALQKAFIIERDARCRGIISSNAYIVIEKDIDEAIKREAAQRAKEDDENDDEDDEPIAAASIKRNESEIDVEEIEIEGVKYVAPCYAYISRTDDKKLPLHILRIERIFKNENGDDAVQGFWVYRPEETLHLANRKFMKKEVFITPFRDTVLVDRLKGKCLVVAYQTFIEQIFTDFDEEDVYACEFKYYGKPKYFRKFKNWPYLAEDDELNMEKRKKVLTPKKSSVEEVDAKNEITAEGSGTSENDDDDDDDDEDKVKCETVLDIDRYETEAPTSGSTSSGETTRTYFHQIRTATGKFYSLGQFVLVFNADKPLCDVMRIDKLWREKNGDEYFSGCWFARPIETVHDKSRLFWTNEVFAVYRNDETRKCSEIQNLCSVLTPKTYVKERQTDVAECDVFVCESMLIGCKEQPENCSLFCTAGENVEFKSVPMLDLEYASKTRKLKTYKLVSSIPNEEYFIFKTPISMENEISPLLKTGGALPLDHLDDFLDDDTDGSESVASTMVHQFPATTTTPMVVVKGGEPFNNGVNDNNGASSVMLTPQHAPSTPTYSATPYPSRPITTAVTVINTSAASAALAPTPKTIKSKSGYILFSAEVRKRIMHENPDAGFGEVSKIVGIEWKKLSEEQKKHYEVRAEVVAQEKAKQDAIKTAQERALQPGQIRIYQCKWANCDSQFDQEGGLHEHIIQHHTSQIIMDSDQQYVCMWVTCLRNRKDGKPFPSLPRLHRHMKEKHMPTSLRNVYQNQIGKNFFKLIVVGEPPVTQLVNAPYGRMPPPMPQQIQVQHQQQQPHPMNGVVNGHMQHHQQMMNGGGSMMQQQQQQQQHQQHQQQQQHHHQDHQQQQQQQQQHHGYQQMGNGMYQQMPTTSSHQSIPQQPYPQHHQYQQQYQTNQSHSQQQHQQQHQQQQQHHHHHHQQQQSQHQHQQQQQQHNQQQQQQQHQQQQVQQVIISDPGRTIVRAIAPVFVAPPNSIHSRRVLHSEAYLKYIESLSTNRQKSVSRWEKSIGATHRNTQNAGQQNKLPTHWIRKTSDGKPVAREEDVTKALWKLRDELLKNTCNLMVDRQTI